ncbi:VOC family protein [Tianweitania sp. BSSL-BM11]|uniref:VOC family protein n=1 Tax=Tianweitania aestuarii TaxID=2814886 RepID=A0ABS5RVV2_9HYPH|nr:VOC family protein [Tianweitania aestuarii]MBS9721179.1 VOC family protein [Tianweitania aestuarii]
MTPNTAATRIAAIALGCADPLATIRLYVQTFDCQDTDTSNECRLGELRLVFDQATAPGLNAPPSNSTAFQHCAIIVSDMRAAMARLEAAPGWTPISRNGPEHLPAASGGATAFKFRDPDGHPLELLQFPADNIPEPWKRPSAGPFLGIDHSAITVSDTDEAIAFWQELGFQVTDRHWNRGPEQARMDGLNTPDAVVEVTTLMPAGGAPPHLELLCYQTPRPLLETSPNGSPFATTLHLGDAPARNGPPTDPNGHRFRLLQA